MKRELEAQDWSRIALLIELLNNIITSVFNNMVLY